MLFCAPESETRRLYKYGCYSLISNIIANIFYPVRITLNSDVENP